MRRLLLSGFVVACGGATMALSPVYSQDWNPPSSGTPVWINNFNGYLTKTGSIQLDATVHTYAVGVYSYNISYSGPVTGKDPRRNFLCVEVDQNRYLNDYETKALKGYAGYFANQINGVSSMAAGNARFEQSIALALATWDFIYDSTLYAVGSQYSGGPITSAELYNGRFKLVSNFAGLNMSNIETQFVNYVNGALRNDPTDYQYYHNPKFPMGDSGYSQDLIGTVPGPAAVLPFLLGFGAAMRRRRK